MIEQSIATDVKPATEAFSGYQKFIIAILVFLQFTIILDFMILSPLGAILMPALKISTTQFGAVVSGYAISAAISAFLAAGIADKYDRKKLLLFFYVGFLAGTFLCGIANSYEFLLIARIVTGLFGGVIGSIAMAILTDVFKLEQRGRVMGFMQTAFAASQVFGLPVSLYLSTKWNWHTPFMMIVVVGIIAGILIYMYMKPINEHLKLQTPTRAYDHLINTLKVPIYLVAFLSTGLLSLGGFMIMPFGSTFTVNNLGIDPADLPMIYFITGLFSIVMGPLAGKISDKIGKLKVFIFGTIVTMIMVVIYTNLEITPLYLVIIVNTLMFVGIFSRMVPSQALVSAIPNPSNRGAFMAVSSSLQSLAGGIGSILAGAIVVQTSSGRIEYFDRVGYFMCFTAIICVYLVIKINRHVMNKKGA